MAAKATLADRLLAIEVDALADKMSMIKTEALEDTFAYRVIRMSRLYASHLGSWTPKRLYTHCLTGNQ